MAEKKDAPLVIGAHGSANLPSVTVDSYNIEIRDKDGFLGDRASGSAFWQSLADLRKALAKSGGDPLKGPSEDRPSKRDLDTWLRKGSPLEGGLVLGLVEAFAADLSQVVHRMLKTKAWQKTERIVIGGGFVDSRIGHLAVGRAAILLQLKLGERIDLQPIRHHPDEAGLIGAIHLMPSWMLAGHDTIVAVDIGGSNLRVGTVGLGLDKAKDLSKAVVDRVDLWRHADDEPKRDAMLERLVEMIERRIKQAKRKRQNLAPFIGVAVPGIIEEDGVIDRGAQNLPGNWETETFNLPRRIIEAIPKIAGQETLVLVHNDAVVQGLSEVPFMRDVERWGVLTIGTGLGNARFTNRKA